MEPALQVIVVTKSVAPVPWVPQDMTSLPGEGSDGSARSDLSPVGRLARNAADGAAGDRRDGLQEMPGLGIAMQSLRHSADAPRQMRGGFGNGARDLGQRLPRHRSDSLRDNGEQFARRHPDEREKVLRRLVFGFRLCSQLSQVLHHGIGVDLADRADFVFPFEGAFVFVLLLAFSLAKKAADDVADGAEPTLPFEAKFILEFVFHLLFTLTRVFIFEFVLHQFTLALISHDDSSCTKWSNVAKPRLKTEFD
jgi:hypothetical protein